MNFQLIHRVEDIRNCKTVPADALITAADTIFATFVRAARHWPDRPFLHAPSEALGGGSAISLTFGQVAGRVSELMGRYGDAGYGGGHRIGLMLDNHPDFFVHFLAFNALGASIVPLNSAIPDAELGYVANLAELDLIVAWPTHVARVGEALEAAGCAIPLAAAVAGGGVAGLPARSARMRLDREAGSRQEAAMLFTSGTTGTPKGCVLSNDYFTWVGHFYTRLDGYCAFRAGEERILTPLPVTHMNALACTFMAAMMSGGCLIQLDRFHASTWWKTVRETGATIVHYLGVMPAILLQRPDRPEEYSGHQVRFAFGAGVDPRHHAVFEERYGFPLIEAWAMSETGAAAWITANREPRHVGTRCFGHPPAHLEVRLVDETGADVVHGDPGELLVRARGDNPRLHFFSGYHKDAEATEAAWEGGWFHTGDIVRRDGEGAMYFVDRIKNIIRRSGENIASVEVEGVLMQHPAVEYCAVLPVADEIRGEEVMALVEAKGIEPGLPLAEAIAGFCRDQLQYFKVPGYVAFVDALPTTESQKLRRGDIRKLGRDLLERGLVHDLRALKRERVKTP